LTAVAYDGKLLACEQVEKKERFIIQSKDKPFVDYVYDVDNYLYEEFDEPSTINCKTFTPPPKPSSTVRNLTTPKLPEDVIDLIAARFVHDVHCESCRLTSFKMTFLERCRTALAQNQWYMVQSEVEEEGGSCRPSTTWEDHILRNCMTSSMANQAAVCHVQSAADNLEFIELKEEIIKENMDAIQGHKELIKTIQERQEFNQPTAGELVKDRRKIEEMQELIKVKQKKIRDLQDAVDMLKQNIVYLKQIFEGP